MAKTLDHDDAMELAVRLTCAFIGKSQSENTEVEELLLHFYRQVRNVEARLGGEYTADREAPEEGFAAA